MSKAEKTIEKVRANRPLGTGAYLFSVSEREAKMTPAVMVESILAKVENLKKPWEKEELLRKSIKRAHLQLSKLNVRTTAGLKRAQQWNDAIGILQDTLDAMDQQASMMNRALTCTFKLLMGGNSKEIYRLWWDRSWKKTTLHPDGTKKVEYFNKNKPRRVVVVEGVRSFPVEKDGHGNVKAWAPGISVDARMEPRGLAVQGSRWENGKLVRFATDVSPSIRQIGEAELGREDEFVPLGEPDYGQQSEIRREAGTNHTWLPEDYDRAFNVVDEERVNRRYTYDPEKERAWLDVMLYAVDSARTPRELMYVMDELIQKAWEAKLVRFNIYEEAHNACVLKGREKCSNHPVIGQWRTVGDSDMKVPEVTKKFEKWALLHPTSDKVKALSAHWENLMRREGLGAGFDGQPFSDTSKDALEQKESRAGDGSLESLDRMFSGDDDSDEDEANTRGAVVHTQAVDSVLTLEDLEKERMNPAEAFSMACALFGRTRGASVDLIHRPRVSATPWKSIPRPHMQTMVNPEEAINAAVRQDMEEKGLPLFSIDENHPDSAPLMEGFSSLDKLLKAFISPELGQSRMVPVRKATPTIKAKGLSSVVIGAQISRLYHR